MNQQRRNLFLRITYIVIGAPLSWIGLHYLFPSLSKTQKQLHKIRLGKIDEIFSKNNFVITKIGNTDAIVFKQENKIEALSLRCTHADCITHYSDDSKKFYCPCHGGEFNHNGTVAKSPPTKPLHHLFVSVHDDVVYVSDKIIS